MIANMASGTHFTNNFSITIQIRWKNYSALIQLLVIISQQNLAHTTTAQLSCHVPNFVAITYQYLDESKMKFPSHLNCDGKIVSEMGPSFTNWSGWLQQQSDVSNQNYATSVDHDADLSWKHLIYFNMKMLLTLDIVINAPLYMVG